MADGFQPKFVDLVRNTTSTVGTGNFNLGAAATGFTSFTAALQVGDSFYYSAIGVDKPAEREVGRGTLLSGGAVSRDPISGVKTNFSSGTKTVALIAAAEWYGQVQAGSSAATRTVLASSRAQGGVTLCESGREGLFAWKGSNQSANISADPAQGIYVPPASDPTGASGAWVRRYSGSVNVKWFGAAGDGTTDDSGAFKAAIAYLKAAATIGYGYGYAGSARLFVPQGVYWLDTTTLEITHGMILEGESVGYLGPGSSVLKWAASTTGIRLETYNTSGATDVLTTVPANPITGDASIRNLTLYGAGSGSEGEFHGIQLRATGAVEDVGIYNFQGDGVHIVATAGGGSGTEGNANCFHLKRVFVQNCRNGFFIDGADVNAAVVHACSAVANRRWGFWDSSFLGNTYVGCQSDSNGLVPGATASVVSYTGNRYCVKKDQGAGASINPPSGTTADNDWWFYTGAGDASPNNNINAWASGTQYRDGGAYRSDGEGNANNLFSGCYIEGGQGFAQIDPPSLVMGGSMRPNVRGVSVLYSGVDQLISDASLTTTKNITAHGDSISLGTQDPAVAKDTVFNFWSGSSESGSWFWRWASGAVVSDGYIRNVLGTFYINATHGVHLRAGGADVLTADLNGVAVTGGVNAGGPITSSGGGIGYSMGAGGAVAQANSKSDGVTLDKLCGQVTMNTAQLASNTGVSFTVANSQIAATDTIDLVLASGGATPGTYAYQVDKVDAGSFAIWVRNISAGPLSEELVFNFSVKKAVNA